MRIMTCIKCGRKFGCLHIRMGNPCEKPNNECYCDPCWLGRYGGSIISVSPYTPCPTKYLEDLPQQKRVGKLIGGFPCQ